MVQTSSYFYCDPFLFHNLFRTLYPLSPATSHHLKTHCDGGVHTCEDGGYKAVGELSEKRQGVERDCAAGGKAGSEDCNEDSNGTDCRDTKMTAHILPVLLP